MIKGEGVRGHLLVTNLRAIICYDQLIKKVIKDCLVYYVAMYVAISLVGQARLGEIWRRL